MTKPLLLLLLALLTGCAHSPVDDPADPFEPVNRKIYAFNETVDRVALQPVAKAYVKVTPQPVRTGVGNFFSNLFYPTVIFNDLLQAKLMQGLQDTSRLVVNTTLGIFGIFDVAGPFLGLEKHKEDFGQTLGSWGIGEGWYLVIPLLGPSTNRDLVGRVGDIYADPFSNYADTNEQVAALVLSTVDTRAQYLDATEVLNEFFDPYTFVRGAYLQRRAMQIYDGHPPAEAPEAPEQ